ncbi:hypothetical protein ATANTOWER_008900 [Ataeniobius toweri]|uniref:Vomeronasal type-1 receptor n=1 Tax=Ataeniobius toweri TaxID=208326 RepID=A0ABU7AEH1_9TELE|nr:hypothetical protein [Ataeniobius toweri]
MASCVTEWFTSGSNIILCATALQSSYKLFRDHRGPSVGFFLLGFSAALCILHVSTSSFQREAEWTGEVLAPALVSFDLLWLSQDHNTARVLLTGSCLLLGLSDWEWLRGRRWRGPQSSVTADRESPHCCTSDFSTCYRRTYKMVVVNRLLVFNTRS